MAAITIPSILTANCYFWTPGQRSHERIYNEKRHQDTVAEFFESIDFEVERLSPQTMNAKKDGIEVQFHYYESTRNVYKSFTVYRDGKKSNISVIKKIVAQLNAAAE